jgi:hypothetical protein
MATPNAVSQNMAEAGLIRQCLRGEPTCLDLRSLFVIAVCVLVCTHGSCVRFRFARRSLGARIFFHAWQFIFEHTQSGANYGMRRV